MAKTNSHIKVLQYMYGDLEYFPWSRKINQAYCRRHDYEYVIRNDPPRKDRHTTWHKVPMILEELHDCDLLLFMDADAHFYSQELTIENELAPLMSGKDVLMAQDVAGERDYWTPGKPNTGVILMNVHEQVRGFLETWDRASDVDESTRWKWPPEQLALWNVAMPEYPDFVEVCSEYYLIQGRYGQFIRHHMLTSNEKRAALMQAFCQSRNIE